MWKAIAGVVTLVAALVAYFIDDLVRKRRQLDGLVRIEAFPLRLIRDANMKIFNRETAAASDAE